ncbi:MAG: hypothetical protein MjAS7_0172 [Metallosphaera javensis (ex Sakai et al. 2022)]|nr:MAG: hypothetical protein MjAS7_0172 [Metallosphaera javensis (ex Sakai et al. 2022)]
MEIRSLITSWIKEADELLEKGDIVQASEKYYKAAEETIKLLAIKHDLKDIIQKVKVKRRWESRLLFDVASKISDEIYYCWTSAWTLHVYGFHEMKLNLDQVRDKGYEVKKINKAFINKIPVQNSFSFTIYYILLDHFN